MTDYEEYQEVLKAIEELRAKAPGMAQYIEDNVKWDPKLKKMVFPNGPIEIALPNAVTLKQHGKSRIVAMSFL